jgi:predicted Zn finger-like uncharacterized protein
MVEVLRDGEVPGELELANKNPREIAAEMKQANIDRLNNLEATIERGLDMFMDVGAALVEINEFKLFLVAGYKTFNAYAERRWGLSKTGAYKKIYATRVMELLQDVEEGTLPVLPANETQAQALSPLLRSPEKLRAAWTQAIEGVETAVEVKPRALRIAIQQQLGVEDKRLGRKARQVKCPECGHTFDAKAHEVMVGQGTRTDKS